MMSRWSLCGALLVASFILTAIACGTNVNSPTVPTGANASAGRAGSSSPSTTGAQAVLQTARQGKTDVCHRTDGATAFILITVADASVAAHLRHGDGRVGASVPGHPGMVFGADCTLIPSCSAPPGTPGFLGWTTAGFPSGSVQLNWEAGTGTVTSYVVEIRTTGGTDVTVVDTGSAGASYVLTGLQPSVDYYHVRVRAKNACGVSEPSNQANPRIS